MKLGFSSDDLKNLILTRLNLVKVMSSSQGTCETYPTLRVETPLRTNSGDKTNSVPCFFPCNVFILTSHFIPSFSETEGQYPQLGVLY
jgi:hypothetical protein